MGDFDIFNFLYALTAFIIGVAAILGAMLALMSIFPMQKIDNRESMLCQRLNEMVSIANQNVFTLDEFMIRYCFFWWKGLRIGHLWLWL